MLEKLTKLTDMMGVQRDSRVCLADGKAVHTTQSSGTDAFPHKSNYVVCEV